MKKLFYFIYTLLTLFITVIVSPYFIFLILKARGDEVRERLGLGQISDPEKLKKSQVIWLHGASVGEVKVAGEVMRELKKSRDESCYFIVTAMTPAGRELARDQLENADQVSYIPVDFPPLLYLYLRRLQPDLLLLMETELWPALINEAARRGSSVAILNGRISDDSYVRYRKINFFLSPFIKLISRFYMQNERGCKRIVELGAPSSRVELGGNIKFGVALSEAENDSDDFRLAGDRTVFAAGSTHDPEEEFLLDLFIKLKEAGDITEDFLLIIAPRHIKRREEIVELLDIKNIKWQQRSNDVDFVEPETDVFLLDTIGELITAYRKADLAFVGGTLAEVGGHNFLEPLACDTPVIMGSSIYEIETDLVSFKEDKYVQVAGDRDELENLLESYLKGLQSEEIGFLAQGSPRTRLLEESSRAREQICGLFELLPLAREFRRLLFVRLSALGDVIHVLPAFSLLARKRPQYELHWLVEPLAAPLIQNNKHADRAEVLPRDRWRGETGPAGPRRIKNFWDYLKNLAEVDYDLALDVHGLLKSAIPVHFSGANITWGPEDAREGSNLFYKRVLYKFGEDPEEGEHRITTNLKYISSVLGCELPEKNEIDYGLKLKEGWQNGLPNLLKDFIISAEKERRVFGVVHPVSSWPSKNWLLERYRLLISELLDYGINIVISGSESDRGRLEYLTNSFSTSECMGELYNAAGRIDLMELYGILKKADFFLGADTGPMHLAAAAETKVAAIMGPTSPQIYGPYCQNNTIIRKENLNCLGCHEQKCPLGHNHCMQKLEVKDVLAGLKVLFSGSLSGNGAR